MSTALAAAGQALGFAFAMFWEILWALVLGFGPRERAAVIVEAQITLNYTTILNLLSLAVAAGLAVRFLQTGGPTMLKMMDRPTEGDSKHYRGDGGHDA